MSTDQKREFTNKLHEFNTFLLFFVFFFLPQEHELVITNYNPVLLNGLDTQQECLCVQTICLRSNRLNTNKRSCFTVRNVSILIYVIYD